MSEDGLRQAGHYALKSFSIVNANGGKMDIRMMIHTFNIVESMSMGSVRGSAVVYDSNDLVTRLPIKAEEFIEIVYEDYFGEELTETYFLYSITDVGYAKDKSPDMVKYTLNFVSLGKVFSENFRVAKAYKPNASASTIAGYVQELYDEYYVRPLQEVKLPTKEIMIDPTIGTSTYVIPRLTPEQAMYFFSRKAYSPTRKSQSFRFFETREKYYFATNEYMEEFVATGGIGNNALDPTIAMKIGQRAKTIPIFTRNYAPDKSAERQEAAMYQLIDIDFGVKTDTVDDINSGAYYRTAYEVDMINGTMNKIDYNHFTYNDDKPNLKFPHDQTFVDQRISKPKERFIIKDYASTGNPGGEVVGPDKNYSNLHNIKTSYFYHYNKNKVNATIYGRNTLFAGSVIDLLLTPHISDGQKAQDPDAERSGRYIVESVENLFFENTFTQKLVLSRSGIGA